MIFSQNPYNVLGLPIGADDLEITKRYKEIKQYLRLNEIPNFSTDIKGLEYEVIRTVESVNDAHTVLSHQSKKLRPMFYWFTNLDNVDEEAHKYLSDGKFLKAGNIWTSAFKKDKKPHYGKNTIILKLLMIENKFLFTDSKLDIDYQSLIIGFVRIINSDKYWKEFESIYNLHNDVELSKEKLNEFKESIKQKVAEDLFDLAEVIGDSDIYTIYASSMGIQAKELDDNKNVTEILDIINSKLDEIKSINQVTELHKMIIILQESFRKLREIGLERSSIYQQNFTKVISVLRKKAISTQKEYNDKKSLEVMNQILSFDLPSHLKKQVRNDIKILQQNIKENNLLKGLEKLLKKIKHSSNVRNNQKIVDWVEMNGSKFGVQDFFLDQVSNAIDDGLDEAVKGERYQRESYISRYKNIRMLITSGIGDYAQLSAVGKNILAIYLDSLMFIKFKKKSQQRGYWGCLWQILGTIIIGIIITIVGGGS